jgi:hypothetical protein
MKSPNSMRIGRFNTSKCRGKLQKMEKKVKSPNSMRIGRFNTSKCRGKLQKMGVLYTHSPKMPGSSSELPKKIKK